ncbi:MAG: hypothetical protein QW728_07305 [Thermoplasmata archaeon]
MMMTKSLFCNVVMCVLLLMLGFIVVASAPASMSPALIPFRNAAAQSQPIQIWFVSGETVANVKDKSTVLNWTLYVKNALPTEPAPITVNCNVTVSAETGMPDVSNTSFSLPPGETFAVNVTLFVSKGTEGGEKTLTALVNASYSKGLGIISYPVTNSTTYYIMPYAQIRLKVPEGNASLSSEPNKDVVYNLLLNNTGNAEEYVKISLDGAGNLTASGWNFSYFSSESSLTVREEIGLSVTVRAPPNTPPAAYQFIITATARVEIPSQYRNSSYPYTTNSTSKVFTLTILQGSGGGGDTGVGSIPSYSYALLPAALGIMCAAVLLKRR